MISQNGLGLDAIGSMAVSPDGSRTYFGLRGSSDRDRMNLAVVTLDASAQRVGDARFYADSTLPLPFGDSAEVDRILIDSAHHKLYLVSNAIQAGGAVGGDLTVYDLDSNWEPIAATGPDDTLVPKVPSVVVPARNQANGLALNPQANPLDPQTNLLYVAAAHDANIYVYSVASQPGAALPEPKPYLVSDNPGAINIAVDSDRARLYLDAPAFDYGSNTYRSSLEVVDLDANGLPLPPTVRSYPLVQSVPGLYFDFTVSPQAIYWRQDYAYQNGVNPQSQPLWVWQLGPDGNPVGTPQALTQFGSTAAVVGSAAAVDPERNMLWVAAPDTFTDAFTGNTVVDGTKLIAIPLDSSGLPAGPGVESAFAYYVQESLLMAVAADGSPVLLTPQTVNINGNQVSDYWLEVTVQQADPIKGKTPLPSPFPVWLDDPKVRLVNFTDSSGSNDSLVVGQTSDPLSLDPFLTNTSGQQPILLGVGPSPSSSTIDVTLTIRFDFWRGNPSQGGAHLTTLTESAQGNNVFVLVPGYGFLPPGERDREFQEMSQHGQEYAAAASQVAPNPGDGPQDFIISDADLLGGEGNAELLQHEAEAISRLGFNTTEPNFWRGLSDQSGLDVTTINTTLAENGIKWRSLSTNFLGYTAYSHHNIDPLTGAPIALPALFDFPLTQSDPKNPTQSILASWVHHQLDVATKEGTRPEDVIQIAMHDEPTWNFDVMVNEVKAKPDWLAGFQSYLKNIGSEQGLDATDFDPTINDPTAWNQLMPIGASTATTANAPIQTRRLFYWTTRFLVDSNANAFHLARQALQAPVFSGTATAGTGDTVTLPVGASTTDNAYQDYIITILSGTGAGQRRLITSYDGKTLVATVDTTWATNPDANSVVEIAAFPNLRQVYADWNNLFSFWYGNATGGADWLESGRLGASSPHGEPGQISDQQAEWNSITSDVLRSASMLTTPDPAVASQAWRDFGMNIDGTPIGGFPSGASYKILSVLGHGAKSVNLPVFGPAALTTLNAWSERYHAGDPDVYGPIAQALRLVRRAEPVLYPGRPEQGNVAVFLPNTSNLWETQNGVPLYESNPELFGLHYALVHAGYTVDFVDDTDLAKGALADRGYTTLYLTGPNVAAAAQQQVKNWVAAGGTLVVTPGAATADEYNRPTDILDPVLGLQMRQPIRDRLYTGTDAITLFDDPTAKFFGSGTMNLYGRGYALTPDGATVEGTLNSGGAGLTVNHYGTGPIKGTAIAYGFFPGLQYWLSSSQSIFTFTDLPRLPQRWGQVQRQMADAPATLAKTLKPVTVSQQVVEADRLQSDQGIAITLLNWTGQPISNLTVTVPNVGPFTTVWTANGVPVHTELDGDTMQVTLPLDHVDVLLLQDSGATPTIDGAAGDEQFVITPTAVQRNGQTVVSGPYRSLTLNGVGGNDQFAVLGTPAGSHVTLKGAGNDTFNVGSTGNTLDPIQGTLDVYGQGATSTLNVNDAGTSSHEWYDVSASQVQRFPWLGVGQPLGDPTQTINYFNVKYLNVYGGSGHSGGIQDVVAARSTLASTALTSLYGGSGPNEFLVFNASQTLDDIQGPVALHGGSSGDFAEIIDQLNTVGHNYTLTAGRLQRDQMADITYDGLGEVIVATADNPYVGHSPSTVNIQSTFNGLTGVEVGNKDTVTIGSGAGVQPAIPSTTAGIVGQLGIVVPYAGDKPIVTIDDSGDTNAKQVDLSSDTSSDYLVNGLGGTSQNPGEIYFRLEPGTPLTLTTGTGDDVFRVHDFTNAPAISIDAEPATSTRSKMHNKLDYSLYTGSVKVDLPLQQATGFAKIAHIQDVTGSQGNSLIVGDDNANVLVGGTGRNVLIGGKGADTLSAVQANTGDNIMIGGYTDYDRNPAALDAIFAEWTRPDLSFQDRFSDLTTFKNGAKAAPLNVVDGTPILLTNAPVVVKGVVINQTVHADGATDYLTGGGTGTDMTGTGLNWFIADVSDVINNGLGPRKGKDKLTKVM
jgi:hypothetical protein